MLNTPIGRRWLFFALYLSEGAPIGYIWLALPTRLRAAGVELTEITALTSLLVLPWTFKFLAAPFVDGLRNRIVGRRHYVIGAQVVMGATILSTIGIDPVAEYQLLSGVLVAHACAAATQDVAIDGLCIASTEPAERGRLNGWMQAGMLAGRASMGGGALVLEQYIGAQNVVLVLVAITTFSLFLLLAAGKDMEKPPSGAPKARLQELLREVGVALASKTTWVGIFIALLGGAAFKSLDVIYGPYLIDHDYTKDQVGWFAAVPMIGCTAIGALTGGWLADRAERTRMMALSLIALDLIIVAFALSDLWLQPGHHLLVLLAAMGLMIGVYLSASYALFMDLTRPVIAATQFAAFMGATNGCESWSVWAIGELVESSGYAAAILWLCLASTLALPALWWLSILRRP